MPFLEQRTLCFQKAVKQKATRIHLIKWT